MNTPQLLSRVDTSLLPQWNGGSGMSNYSEPAHGHANAGAKVRHAVKKYWWVGALVAGLVAVPTVLLVYMYVKPSYETHADVQITPYQVKDVMTGHTEVSPFYREFVLSQVEALKSPKILDGAQQDARLKNYEWFQKLADQPRFLAEHLTVEMIPNSQLIRVSNINEDAHTAANIVNSVLDSYNKVVKDSFLQSAEADLELVGKLRETTESALKSDQNQLALAEADGKNLSTELRQKLLNEQISTERETLGKLEGEALGSANLLDNLKSAPAPDKETFLKTIDLQSDQLYGQWSMAQAKKKQDEITLSTTTTPLHPDRVKLREEIKELNTKMEERKATLLAQAWSKYEAAQKLDRDQKVRDAERDVKSLADQIANLKTNLAGDEDTSRMTDKVYQPIVTLRGKIADEKEQYNNYNKRYTELQSQVDQPGRISVLYAAPVPLSPTVDKRPRFAGFGIGGGMVMGALAMLIVAKLRNRIMGTDDLPQNVQPLVIGTVSNAALSRGGSQGGMRRKILSEEMRLVHANLLPPGKNERRIIMVTSPTPGNGKTSISSHLALSLAKSGLDVLLIDADLRKRDLTVMFDSGLGFRPGLAELLQEGTPELIRPVELLPNFRVMGAGGKLDRNPAELFQRQNLREILDKLSERYDVIILDTPPALVVADARLIARSADEVLCVVRAQVSSQREINQTLEALSRVKGEMPKLIVNGVEHHHSYYKHKFDYTDGVSNGATKGHGAKVGPMAEVWE